MLLYIILIHHQTTTAGTAFAESHPLYIIFIHHQTTTVRVRWYSPGGCISSLFITKPQLIVLYWLLWQGRISSLFITKPQHKAYFDIFMPVVSHPYSSPNHNSSRRFANARSVVSHPYSSPNHNLRLVWMVTIPLYLILIHHQTTTLSG